MNMSDHISDNTIATLMHTAGIRLSAQRIAIMSYIGNSHLHPSADMIYSNLKAGFPSLSLATVYNTLHTLIEKKLVREIEIDTDVMRYDMVSVPHAHFKCQHCGRITDVPLNDMQSSLPPGFHVDTMDVYYKGICPECHKNEITK